MVLRNTLSIAEQLSEEISGFYADPLGYVMFVFPWDTDTSIQQVELDSKYYVIYPGAKCKSSDCPVEGDHAHGPDTWACEFLDELGEDIRKRGFDGLHAVEPIQYITTSGHGIGKDQPYSMQLDTPSGLRQWGNIQVGDQLFGPKGSAVNVVARHEQGIRPMYRVTFSDGTSTLAGASHMWNIRGRQERRNGLEDYKQMSTIEIMEAGVKRPNGDAMARQWEIPSYAPVDYPEQELAADPYVAGVWLGDGTKRNGQITSADDEIWDYIKQAGFSIAPGYFQGNAFHRTVYGLKMALVEAGIFGCTTLTACVPTSYKYVSVEQRLAMLQGLLDTDGWVEKSGTVAFGSISHQLASDVAWLARSLGMVARTKPAKEKFYRDSEGKKIFGKPFFTASITWDGETKLFRLDRKQKLLTKPEERYRKRWIDSISYSHDEQSMCVTVDSSDGLYLTSDFIVTHNSALVAWLIKFILDTRPYSKGVVTANTADQLRTKTWAELGKWHRLSITSHLFTYTSGRNAMSIYHNEYREGWRCDAQTCREENSEAFAGLHAANSTPFYIFDEGCFCDQTEVMTSRGWQLFECADQNDSFLTPEGWQQATAFHKYPHKKNMLSVEKRGLSLSVTPEHEMYGKSRKGIWGKTLAKDISLSGIAAPRIVQWSASEGSISDDELKLMAWYYSEGHLIKNSYAYKDNGIGRPRTVGDWHGFGITNNLDLGISDLLDRLNLKWSKHRNQWLVYEPKRAIDFAEQGIGCIKKTLPDWLLQLSQRQLRVFLDTYVLGDGYTHGKARVIYTSSPNMASMLHAMAVLAGFNSSLTRRKLAGQRKWIKDHWAVSSCDGYVISLSETGSDVYLTRDLFKSIPYDGIVYCVTVPAGLILTRRNGTVIWAGNSAVPDKIYEVREGGTTDGEPMTFDFGNPTRNTGAFYENCQGRRKHRYKFRRIDSRNVKITSKPRIQAWAEDYGEDSDFFKVRVKGEFPSAGSLQFIPTGNVETAMVRPMIIDRFAPLLIGVDVARFGDDDSVIYPRIGNDARSFPIERFKGLDTVQLVGRVIATLRRFHVLGMKCSGLFIDGGGLGAGVVDQLRHLGYSPIEVQFGGGATDKQTYRFKSDEMWGNMREAIATNLILPDEKEKQATELKVQLTQRQFGYTIQGNKVHLESKKDMKERLGGDAASPDIADALALTYAFEVAPLAVPHGEQQKGMVAIHEFDPLAGDGPPKEKESRMVNSHTRMHM